MVFAGMRWARRAWALAVDLAWASERDEMEKPRRGVWERVRTAERDVVRMARTATRFIWATGAYGR